MITKIKVSAREIIEGQRNSPCGCPIALALKSVVKENVKIEVGTYDVDLHFAGDRPNMHALPKKAHNFISNFDTYRRVKEFSFVLNIPDEYLKQTVAA